MDWNAILSSVLQAVLIVLLPPLVVAAVKWILAQANLLVARVREWQPDLVDMVEQAANFAVKAAEQAGIGGLAEDKKKYALEVAEKWLAAKGWPIDLDLIDAAIEKAVLELFNTEPSEEGMGLIRK